MNEMGAYTRRQSIPKRICKRRIEEQTIHGPTVSTKCLEITEECGLIKWGGKGGGKKCWWEGGEGRKRNTK